MVAIVWHLFDVRGVRAHISRELLNVIYSLSRGVFILNTAIKISISVHIICISVKISKQQDGMIAKKAVRDCYAKLDSQSKIMFVLRRKVYDVTQTLRLMIQNGQLK